MVKDNKEKLKIEYVSIKGIRPNEYNPKKMTEKEAQELEESITKFGPVDPIICNKAEGREGRIIGVTRDTRYTRRWDIPKYQLFG